MGYQDGWHGAQMSGIRSLPAGNQGIEVAFTGAHLGFASLFRFRIMKALTAKQPKRAENTSAEVARYFGFDEGRDPILGDKT